MTRLLFQRVRKGGTAGACIVPQATSGDTPINGATIDRLDTSTGAMADSALIAMNWAAATGGTVSSQLTLQEGSTSSPTTPVTLVTALPSQSCAADGSALYEVDLRGMGRYFRIILTPTHGTSGTANVGVTVVLGDENKNPEATAATIYRKSA
jgi:hypothetical protein